MTFSKIFLSSALMFATSLTSFADVKSSSEEFLTKVREARGVGLWALMKGRALHKVHDNSFLSFTKKRTTVTFDLSISFDEQKTEAQVIVNSNEFYRISQDVAIKKSHATVAVSKANKTSHLLDFGLRPADLAMSFLYWDLQRELEPVSLRAGTVNCRVFLLKGRSKSTKSPLPGQSDLQQKFQLEIESAQVAKVYISTDGLFPVKVEWFAGGYAAGMSPLRTLKAGKPMVVDGVNLVGSLSVVGEDWETSIQFKESKVQAGPLDTIPDNFFIDQ